MSDEALDGAPSAATAAEAAAPWLVAAGVVMALAVALGAFGAHGLRSMVDAERVEVWKTAAAYQAMHGLGLVAVAVLTWIGVCAESQAAVRRARWCGRLFVVGVVVFSGSLYALVLTDVGLLGAITPIGGTAFIAGWAAFAWGALGLRRERG